MSNSVKNKNLSKKIAINSESQYPNSQKTANNKPSSTIANEAPPATTAPPPQPSKPKPKEMGDVPRIVKLERFLNKNYDLRINTIIGRLEGKAKHETEYTPIEEEKLVCELFESGFTRFKDELKALMAAKVPKYDPFKEYFDKLKPWDGKTDHIAHLASFVETDDQPWFVQMYRKHLVRTVGQMLNLIPFNKHCLTLVGKQHDGKTSFWQFHVPPELSHYYKIGFDFHSGKEGKISLVQNFLINLDELAQFDKSDLNNEFKSVLSEASLKYRPLYKNAEIAIPRRASFVASTNKIEFLTDETGNVRWIIFYVLNIKHDNGGENGYAAKIDINKVWAQAYHLLLNGFPYQLTSDELNQQELLNKRFFRLSYEMDILDAYLIPATKLEDGSVFMTGADLAKYLTDKHGSIKINSVQLGRALAKYKFERVSYRHNGTPTYGYFVRFKNQ